MYKFLIRFILDILQFVLLLWMEYFSLTFSDWLLLMHMHLTDFMSDCLPEFFFQFYYFVDWFFLDCLGRLSYLLKITSLPYWSIHGPQKPALARAPMALPWCCAQGGLQGWILFGGGRLSLEMDRGSRGERWASGWSTTPSSLGTSGQGSCGPLSHSLLQEPSHSWAAEPSLVRTWLLVDHTAQRAIFAMLAPVLCLSLLA